jgi:hypothetical protein
MPPPISQVSRQETRSRLRATLLAVVGLAFVSVGAATLCGDQASELEVKAAFLVNFLKFVEWPADRLPDATTPYVIAVIGGESFGAALQNATADRTIAARKVTVRIVPYISEVGHAHLVFISGSQQRQLPAILRELDGKSVLTVGDTPGYAESGVMLNLVVQDQRVRFEANTAAVARSRLRLSSHLLRIARIVG